jgi:pyruvate formate lyase activating enzyme
LNDDEAQIRGLTRYIARELGAETPWHVSRFFPQYKYQNTDATSVGSIEKAMEIGKAEGLRYVYAGNIAGSADTYCPQCGAVLIKRSGMSTLSSRVSHKGACPVCGARIAGVGLSGEEGSA